MEWTLNQASHDQINKTLDRLAITIKTLPIHLDTVWEPYQEILKEFHETASLIACLSAIDTSDARATAAEAKLNTIAAALDEVSQKIDAALLKDKEATHPGLEFIIQERRHLAAAKMPLEQEILASNLSTSGFSAYTTLYYTFMGSLSFGGDNLSRLEKRFSHPDRTVRQQAFSHLEEELSRQEPIFAQILNNLVDFRLTLYKERKWPHLQESLEKNRLKESSLRAMWDAVSANKEPLARYLKAKAKLLGLDQLSWCDVNAPLGSGDHVKIPWETGCKTILEQFGNVSPKLAAFTKHALTHGWVDAKPGDKRRAGGFCTSLPMRKESRIFMTYTDTFDSQSTLAHELGHAFHSHVLFDKPPLLQNYPMNIAEAASTMCELIVADNAIKTATDPQQKRLLLDDKLSSYVAFNMNIHSRFLFEDALHERRKSHFLTPDELNHLMIESQKTAYHNTLKDYLPHFWCYKMHFYFTDIPFYNWPYTFGYLFSLATYTTLRETGNFENRYIALLQDSGSMTMEALAKKHLGADLSSPQFWERAIALLNRDIDTFLSL